MDKSGSGQRLEGSRPDAREATTESAGLEVTKEGRELTPPARSEDVDTSGAEVKPERETADFFEANYGRLGYRSRLSIALRRALNRLEGEASESIGLSVDELRVYFDVRRLPFNSSEAGWQIERDLLLADYRVFLIFLITVARRRRSTGDINAFL